MNVKEFYRFLGFEPYKHQRKAYEKIFSLSDDGGCVVIKAPTAAGKTEAAVAPYFAGVRDGTYPFAKLIYVLPTRALANAQQKRLKEKIAEKLGLSLKIVVDHGSAHHKPMLNGDVVVCTLDAFVYGFAAQRTFGNRLHYPMGCIASSLVVFDEVQMYQDEEYYTPWLIGKVMKYLYESRIPFVIMTATLPERLEEILFDEIDVNDEIVAKNTERGDVKVHLVEKQLFQSIEDFVDIVNDSQKVGVILNRVPKAQKVFKLIDGKVNKDVILLHSRITAKERKEREDKLLESPEFVVIATQVIEAGLDVSLDLMLTEIAPIDALIQRIGRVARRRNESGEAYVFDVGEDYPPYPEDSLKKTKDVVEDVGRSVKNMEIIQEKINYVYDGISLAENVLSVKADLYFDELRLFSLPPEYDLRVRPEIYVTLFVPPKDKIEEIRKDADRSWGEKALNPAKDLELDSAINEYTFNVSYSWFSKRLNEQKDILLRNGEGYISLEWGVRDGKRVVGFNTRYRLVPYITYIVNPEYYDQELGLVTGDGVA